MLIKGTPDFYIVISIILFFLLLRSFSRIRLKDIKSNILLKIVNLLFLVSSVLIILLLIFYSNRVYVIKPEDKENYVFNYTAIMSPKYRLTNNDSQTIVTNLSNRYVLNDTDLSYLITPIYYGKCDSKQPVRIEPHSLTNIGEDVAITHYLNEDSPNSIPVQQYEKCEVLYRINCKKGSHI